MSTKFGSATIINMNKKLLVLLVAAAVAVVAYWLLSGYSRPAAPEEQAVRDAEYLLDDSALDDVVDALNDVLLGGSLNSEALAAEASQLESLPDTSVLNETDQLFGEVSQ